MSGSVLVTGGGGFIGTWVLRELVARGMRPVVYDMQRNSDRWRRVLGADEAKVSFVAGDLLDRRLLQKTADDHQVTHIVHLAALLTPNCQQDPYAGCEVNVLGSMALFELARTSARPIGGFAYASSFAVYGPEVDDSSLGLKLADNRPPSFYGAFKMAVDLIAEQYWRHFGIASVGIRPHVVYGPERVVGLTAGPSQAARAAALSEPYTINYTGKVGYDYVEDVARAFVQSVLETPPGSHVVDLPGQVATTEEFVRVIDRVVPGAGARLTVDGPAIPANIPPQPNYITGLFPNWRSTTLEEGVRRTVDFYRQTIDGHENCR
ncbi:MAG: NAD(P)-dependent oxidoreductase [Planctomycetota bacterium]|nr:NAD(P)-dependent oxidoreductase [Planctomycetota bacterium]MDA1177259.1 NAD(P)-dependent oxidoreductase [Planctomycetota bacterium]